MADENPFAQYVAAEDNPFAQYLTPAKPAESGILGTLGGGTAQTIRAGGAFLDTLQNDTPELQAAAAAQAARVKDPRLAAFEADLAQRRERLGKDPGWLDLIGEVGSAAWKNPAGAGLMAVDQLPNSAAMLAGAGAGAMAGSAVGPAGTAAGGIIGGLAGMYAGNLAVEGGNRALEHVGKTGDMSSEDRSRLLYEGAIKAGVITGVDAVTFGMTKFLTNAARRAVETATLRVAEQAGVSATEIAARRAADPAFDAAIMSAQKLAMDGATTFGKRALQTGAALGLETIGEGLGEYLGEFAATGEADKMDAVIEAFSSLGQSAAEVGIAKAWNSRNIIAPIAAAKAPEDAIAAAEAALAAPIDTLTPAVDEWENASLDPLGLPHYAGTPLVTFPDGTTMTRAEYEQRGSGLGPMPPPVDAVAENAPLLAATAQEAQTRLDTVQADEGTTDIEARRPKTILKRAAESIDDNELRAILTNPETSAVTARAVHAELAARERTATPTAEGTGGTNDQHTIATMGGTAMTVPDAAPAKNNTVAEAVAILRTPAEQRVPADTIRLRNVAARIGPEVMGRLEQFVKGPFGLTRDERVATERLIVSDARTAAAPAATPATLPQSATQQQLADNEVGQFSQPRRKVFGSSSQLRSETGPDIKGEKVTRNMRKAIVQWSRFTGTKVVFEFAPGRADGAVPVQGENTIHINTAAQINPLQVMGHEVTHVLRDRFPAEWAKLRDALVATMPDKRAALKAFAENYWYSTPDKIRAATAMEDWSRELTPDEKAAFESTRNTLEDFLLDEMVSDLGGKHWTTEQFYIDTFAKIEKEYGSEKAKGIIERLVAAITDVLNKFLDVVRAQKQEDFSTITAEQLEKTRDAMSSAYAKFIRAERTSTHADGPHDTDHRIHTSDTHSRSSGAESEPAAAPVLPVAGDGDELSDARAAELASLSPARPMLDTLQDIERGKLTMDGEYGYNTFQSLWNEAEGLRSEYPDERTYDIYKDLGGTGVVYGASGYNRYSVKSDGSLAPIPESFSNKDTLAKARAALDAPKLSTQRLFFEAAPNPDDRTATQQWREAGRFGRGRIDTAVRRTIVPGLLRDLHITGSIVPQLGGWMDATNPSFALVVSRGDPALAARAIGYVLDQQAMYMLGLERFTGAEKTGIIHFDIAGKDAHKIYMQVRALASDVISGHSTVGNEMYIGVPADRMQALRQSVVEIARTNNLTVSFDEGYGATIKEYGYGIQGERQVARGLRATARDVDRWRAEADALRSDAAGRRSDRTGVARKSEQRPSYGEGSGEQVVGVHYSRQQRDTLSSAYFGTGMKAQERVRVNAAKDPRIKKRLYFYANTGNGIAPEADVGHHAHSVTLNNIYDMDVDPRTLYKTLAEGDPYQSPDQLMNDFESGVIDAGFDGYMTREFGKGGAVVLLGAHSVPVQYEGERARPDVPEMPAPKFSDEQALRRKLAADKTLPSGQLTGLEWMNLFIKRSTEFVPRWLDKDKLYYRDQLIPRAAAEPARMSESRPMLAALQEIENGKLTMEGEYGYNTFQSLWKEAEGMRAEYPDERTYDLYKDNGGTGVVYGAGGYNRYAVTQDGTLRPIPESFSNKYKLAEAQAALAAPTARRSESRPVTWWYSPLARQAETATMKKAPASGWKSWLKSLAAKGVKPDEIKWSGIEEWLDVQGEATVTREQVQSYLSEFGVKIETILRGESNPVTDSTQDAEDEDVDIELNVGNWEIDDPDEDLLSERASELLDEERDARVEAEADDIESDLRAAVVDDIDPSEYRDDVLRDMGSLFDPSDEDVRAEAKRRAVIAWVNDMWQGFADDTDITLEDDEDAIEAAMNRAFDVAMGDLDATRDEAKRRARAEIDDDELLNELIDQERTLYYDDYDSPHTRGITVDGVDGTFWDSTSYGERNLYYDGREIDLPRRADDADVEGAIRQFVMEEGLVSGGRGGEFRATKWEGYATDKNRAVPGSYREVQLTLPVGAFGLPKTRMRETPRTTYTVYDAEGEAVASMAQEENAKERADKVGGTYKEVVENTESDRMSVKDFYYTTHWSEANVIGHARFDEHRDEDGKRVLVLQEVQGDWGQQRREGLEAQEKVSSLLATLDERRAKKAAARDALAALLPDTAGWRDGAWRSVERLGSQGLDVPTSMVDVHVAADKLMRLTTEVRDLQREYDALNRDLPDAAPFIEKTPQWAGLVLKRMIAHAIEYGFDKVVWTSGAQQVERWKGALRKEVDTIAWEKTEDGIHIVGMQNGRTRTDTKVAENALSDAIGKAMAKQIIADPNQTGEITGDDITISDTGMAGFYDRMLPTIANDILRKFDKDVRVKDIEVHAVPHDFRVVDDSNEDDGVQFRMAFTNENGSTGQYVARPTREAAEADITKAELENAKTIGVQQGFDITDKLRESVANGVPLFSQRRASAEARLSHARKEWYRSQLSEAVGGLPTKIKTGKEAALWLTSNAGKLQVKKDELTWSGVLDWLATQRSVTGAQIQDWLASNGVRVRDVMLGEETPEYKRLDAELQDIEPEIDRLRKVLVDKGIPRAPDLAASNFAKGDGTTTNELKRLNFNQSQLDAMLAYGRALNRKNELFELRKAARGETPKHDSSSLRIPGGKPGTYRELLLTLPDNSKQQTYEEWKAGGMQGEWSTKGVSAAKTLFRSSHYPQPNILAHLRFEEMIDADGKRVMFIQEVQSDWGQKGRKEGFAGTERTAYQVVVDGNPAGAYESMAEADAAKQRALKYNAPEKVEIRQVRGKVQDIKGVPLAPFVQDTKSWVSLALKRAISYAVDNGFDRVAWTTGEQQNDRYDLSKQVSYIRAIRNSDDTYWVLAVQNREGRGGTGDVLFDKDKLTEAELENTIGKDLTQKIVKQEKRKEHEYTGLDLKVGGEGMVAFYDGIVKQVARSLGATVESSNKLLAQTGSVQPGFDITERMKEQAAIGMPLFSTKRKPLDQWLGRSVVRKPMYHGTARDITTFRPQQADAIFLTDDPAFAANFADMSHSWMVNNYWTWMSPDQIQQAKRDAMRMLLQDALPGSSLYMREERLLNQSQFVSQYMRRAVEQYMPSESNIMPLYVRAENPFDYRNPEHVAAIEREIGTSWMGYENIHGAVAEVAQHIGDLERGDWNAIESEPVQRYIRANHDSFYVRERGVTNLAVFSPNQVKSASGNDGSYSREDNDIRRSERRATWTEERIDRLMDQYAYTMDDSRTKGYATWVSPEDYLRATVPEEERGIIEAERRKLNVEELQIEYQPIFLEGEFDTTGTMRIKGHEGRHRMLALRDAGIQHVPVVLRTGIAVYEAKPVENPYFGAQRWGDLRAAGGFFGTAAIPISYEYEQQLRNTFGGDGDVRFSTPRSRMTGQPINQTWPDPDIPEWDRFVEKMQDKMIHTKRVVKAIREAGVAIAEKFDPYMQEILFHGRAASRVKNFANTELRQLLEDMSHRGVVMQDLDDYLWARHAAERNAANARSNPAITDGSGMTDAQAADIIAGRAVTLNGRTIQLSAQTLRGAAALANRVDAITNRTLDLLVEYKLETQQTIDTWKRTYAHYAPLKRDMESDANYSGAFNLGLGTGQGFDIRGAASRRALGSKRSVTDVLANIAMQRERAIVRGEKNRVAQAVYGLALTAPNPEFWIPVNPALNKGLSPAALAKLQAELVSIGVNPLDAQHIASEPVERYIDPKTGLEATRINPRLRNRDDVLSVRINGEDRYVMFSNKERAQRMVAGLKNLDADQLGAFLQTAAIGTRWFASVNTQFNPIFGITNGLRDLSTGMLNLSSTPLSANRAEIARNAFSALKGIYLDLRDHRAGRAPTSQWAQLFEQFALDGGQTGYRDMFQDSKARADEIAKELKHAGKGKQWVAGGEKHSAVFGWLSDYNTAVENAVRLSAYKAYIDKFTRPGMTQDQTNAVRMQAAALSKNLTVNFNKKGLAATQTGALYAFFNAAVQGTARMAETMTTDGKLNGVGQKIVYGGIVLGVMQATLGMLAGWDDEEPPQYLREKNFLIPIPGGDKYLSIPMPLGFHVIPSVGRIATEWMMSGFKDPGKRLTRLAGVLLDAFNPIGGTGSIGQMISPTISDPIIALGENRDWTGKPIYKEDFSKMQPTPGWTRAKDVASPPGKWLSYGLNYLTGGGKYEIGLLSPTPDQIDYLVAQATGGVGREILKTAQYASAKVTGEELPLYKTPLGVGRFVGETKGQASETSRFYDNLRRIGEHKSALEEMKDARDGDALMRYLERNPDARLVQMADKAQREIGYLRRQKRELIENGAGKERVRIVADRITGLTARYNERLAAKK